MNEDAKLADAMLLLDEQWFEEEKYGKTQE